MASEATGNCGGTHREEGNETVTKQTFDFQSTHGLERLPAVFLNRNRNIAPR